MLLWSSMQRHAKQLVISRKPESEADEKMQLATQLITPLKDAPIYFDKHFEEVKKVVTIVEEVDKVKRLAQDLAERRRQLLADVNSLVSDGVARGLATKTNEALELFLYAGTSDDQHAKWTDALKHFEMSEKFKPFAKKAVRFRLWRIT